jgi:aminoglycoside phosphotransferase (APT) family kinase protein
VQDDRSPSLAGRERVIAAFVSSTLGLEASRVARLKAFETNEVYEVDVGEQRFIVKASTHDALRAEAWACARGADADCGAPAIVGFATLDERTSAFIMPRVVGSPIAPGHPAFREVGIRLRRLHQLTRPRFGALAEVAWSTRNEFTLRDDSWLDFVRRICADTRRIGDGDAITAAAAASAAIEARVDAFRAIKVGSLCHGDLKTAHILVDGDRLTGVIDWGDAAIADPLWDVARFGHRADSGSLALLLEAYDPAGTLADEFSWRLPLYSALWMLVDAIVDHRLGHRAEVPLAAALGYLNNASERAR